MKSTMRRLLQLACICGLLLGQYNALTHQVWHLHELLPHSALAQAHEHEHSDGEDGDEDQSPLCRFHLALCGVLVALLGPCLAPVAADAGVERSRNELAPSLAIRQPVARSRGPPRFS